MAAISTLFWTREGKVYDTDKLYVAPRETSMDGSLPYTTKWNKGEIG